MMESNETSKWRGHEGDEAGAAKRNGPKASLIAFVVIIVLAVVFFFQNSKQTTVKFLFFDSHTPVRTAIVVSVVVGVLLDRLISFWWRRRNRDS